MPTYTSGKTGWFRIGNTGYPMRQWELSLSAARVDVTNFLSGGFSEYIAGFASGTVSASGPLDPTVTQLAIGNTYANLSLGLGSNYAVTFSGVLLELRASSAVDKAGEVSVSFGTNGVFNTTFAAS